MSELIKVEQVASILRIVLNNPEKMNAVTQPMYQALADAMQQGDENPEVRVIFLCAEGENFCAGNEIGSFIAALDDPDGAAVAAIEVPAERLLQQLAQLQKPLVAEVKGVAIGIGATMLLHCDLVYADSEARFMLPFINLGLTPEGGSSQLLPRLLGHLRAAELLMLGEMFSAQQAAEWGLINAQLDADQLHPKAWAMALKLAEKPPATLRAIKAMLKNNTQQPLQQVITSEILELGQRLGGAEAKEAVTAFVEKRAPDFSNFS